MMQKWDSKKHYKIKPTYKHIIFTDIKCVYFPEKNKNHHQQQTNKKNY